MIVMIILIKNLKTKEDYVMQWHKKDCNITTNTLIQGNENSDVGIFMWMTLLKEDIKLFR